VKIQKWSISEVATCEECGWSDDSREAVKRGGEHHKKTGHVVTGNLSVAFQYGGGGKYE